MSSDDDRESLPKPRSSLEDATQHASTLSLTELLEQACLAQSSTFGDRPLIGECVDTHNPYLPGRVLVQARGEDGNPAVAWLPVLANLPVRAGQRVLLSKADNWPDPIVVGVIAGLESSAKREGMTTAGEASLRLEPGQGVVVQTSTGTPLMRVSASDDGEARIELLPGNVALEAPGTLRLSGESIELRGRAGGIDLRTEGDAIVRARIIQLN